jgi:hypothetical protein
MLWCWKADPQDRPGFVEVLTAIEEMCQKESPTAYTDVVKQVVIEEEQVYN